MIRKLYAWALRAAHTPQATWALFAVAFAESSFFPITPDALMIPMCLANRQRAWFFATITTLGSVLGGIFGYFIGAVLYDTLGQWLIHLYGMENQMEYFRSAYQHYGAAIILIKGLTPIPYKLVTIVSGVAGYPLIPFILLSLLTRGARFFLFAGLVYRYGDAIRPFVEKHLEKVALALLAVIILGFAAFKLFL